MSESEVRAALRRTGQRRKRLRSEQERLKGDTHRAIHAARGVISVKEAAELADLNRSTVYELYLGDLDGGSNESAIGSEKGSTTEGERREEAPKPASRRAKDGEPAAA